MRRIFLSVFAVPAMLVFGPGAVWASEPVQQHNSNAVWFENWGSLSNATLKIVAPNGQMTELFAASGTPVFQLNGADALDGIYTYELSAATTEQVKIANPINNGRGTAAKDSVAKSYQTTGSFTVARGVIITPEEVSEDDTN